MGNEALQVDLRGPVRVVLGAGDDVSGDELLRPSGSPSFRAERQIPWCRCPDKQC